MGMLSKQKNFDPNTLKTVEECRQTLYDYDLTIALLEDDISTADFLVRNKKGKNPEIEIKGEKVIGPKWKKEKILLCKILKLNRTKTQDRLGDLNKMRKKSIELNAKFLEIARSKLSKEIFEAIAKEAGIL